MHRPLIIANWKSNPLTLKEALDLARGAEEAARRFRGAEIVVAPPFLFAIEVSKLLKYAKLGAQDAFWSDGPYTGEVSWRQLKKIGVCYVILGHSSRRAELGETDDVVNKKLKAVLGGGLLPVLCIGEFRRKGNTVPPIVGLQLKKALKGIKKSQLKNLVIAYEPVWAISTMPGARADTPQSAERAIKYLRDAISRIYGRKAAHEIRMLYGGSVSSKNARDFLSHPGIDGALVGGASLRPQEFGEIISRAFKG
ncbi:MAG: triose-phosphate isomerase [Candidatus Sungbacteria bacterium]|nr:triose-phosphate isomerase [Candidatus Sungbacteria bacterium]